MSQEERPAIGRALDADPSDQLARLPSAEAQQSDRPSQRSPVEANKSDGVASLTKGKVQQSGGQSLNSSLDRGRVEGQTDVSPNTRLEKRVKNSSVQSMASSENSSAPSFDRGKPSEGERQDTSVNKDHEELDGQEREGSKVRATEIGGMASADSSNKSSRIEGKKSFHNQSLPVTDPTSPTTDATDSVGDVRTRRRPYLIVRQTIQNNALQSAGQRQLLPYSLKEDLPYRLKEDTDSRQPSFQRLYLSPQTLKETSNERKVAGKSSMKGQVVSVQARMTLGNRENPGHLTDQAKRPVLTEIKYPKRTGQYSLNRERKPQDVYGMLGTRKAGASLQVLTPKKTALLSKKAQKDRSSVYSLGKAAVETSPPSTAKLLAANSKAALSGNSPAVSARIAYRAPENMPSKTGAQRVGTSDTSVVQDAVPSSGSKTRVPETGHDSLQMADGVTGENGGLPFTKTETHIGQNNVAPPLLYEYATKHPNVNQSRAGDSGDTKQQLPNNQTYTTAQLLDMNSSPHLNNGKFSQETRPDKTGHTQTSGTATAEGQGTVAVSSAPPQNQALVTNKDNQTRAIDSGPSSQTVGNTKSQKGGSAALLKQPLKDNSGRDARGTEKDHAVKTHENSFPATGKSSMELKDIEVGYGSTMELVTSLSVSAAAGGFKTHTQSTPAQYNVIAVGMAWVGPATDSEDDSTALARISTKTNQAVGVVKDEDLPDPTPNIPQNKPSVVEQEAEQRRTPNTSRHAESINTDNGSPSKLTVDASTLNPSEDTNKTSTANLSSQTDQLSKGLPPPSEAQKDSRHVRTKRNTPLPAGQIVAKLTAIQSGSMLFSIGDGKTYGGFPNPSLQPDARYDVYLVASSEVEDVKHSISAPLRVV